MDDTIDMKQEETKMIECYFIPNNNTSSTTICGNCGKEKFLHTIGSGIKVSTYFINPKEEPKQQTLKEEFYKYGKSLGISINDLQRLMLLSKQQQEQNKNIYSEADMREAYFTAIRSTGEGWNGEYANGNCPNIEKTFIDGFEIFIEQYKKK
jgi:hypothetical protein